MTNSTNHRDSKESRHPDRIAAAVFLLAVIQTLVAVGQLLVNSAYTDNTQAKYLGLTIVLAAVFILYYFGNLIFKK